jgi:hypothetical protein
VARVCESALAIAQPPVSVLHPDAVVASSDDLSWQSVHVLHLQRSFGEFRPPSRPATTALISETMEKPTSIRRVSANVETHRSVELLQKRHLIVYFQQHLLGAPPWT